MPLSSTLRAQATYPFVRLNHAAAERRARALEVIDFGMGDLREPTDPAILQALRDGVRERMGYPVPARGAAFAGAYGRKRALLLDVLGRKGLRDAGGQATMYLWIAVPAGETSEQHAARLLDRGVLVTPGSFLGPSGEGYVRYALVPTHDECARAAAILEDVL